MCGPTQAIDSSSATPRGDLSHLVERDRVEQLDRRIGVDVLAEHDRLLGGVAGDRAGVLERDRPSARRIGAGALDLRLGRAVARAAR